MPIVRRHPRTRTGRRGWQRPCAMRSAHVGFDRGRWCRVGVNATAHGIWSTATLRVQECAGVAVSGAMYPRCGTSCLTRFVGDDRRGCFSEPMATRWCSADIQPVMAFRSVLEPGTACTTASPAGGHTRLWEKNCGPRRRRPGLRRPGRYRARWAERRSRGASRRWRSSDGFDCQCSGVPAETATDCSSVVRRETYDFVDWRRLPEAEAMHRAGRTKKISF